MLSDSSLFSGYSLVQPDETMALIGISSQKLHEFLSGMVTISVAVSLFSLHVWLASTVYEGLRSRVG